MRALQLIALQVLLLCALKIVAQPEGSDCAYVLGLLGDEQQADKFFKVLRNRESGGNLCELNTNEKKIGPYQISRDYYEVAVNFNPELLSGKIWNNVWGDLSDDYSREIIRNYLCKIEIDWKAEPTSSRQELIISSIAAMHRGGVSFRRQGRFGNMVLRGFLSATDPPPISSETCDPPCKAAQCCRNNTCYCLRSDTLEEYECEVEECEPQQVEGLDVVFVLDSSGSIGRQNFESMKETVINIVSSLTIGPQKTRVAVVRFSSQAVLLFNLNTHTTKETLSEAIRDINYSGGGTNTAAALQLLRTSVFSELLGVRSDIEATKIAIVITDGRSNNAGATKTQAELLRAEANFLVFAIGIGSGVGVTELTNIAGSSNTVIQLQGFMVSELLRLEQTIVENACLVAPSPQLDESTEVDRTLGQGTVTHYQVQIPEEGLTFMIDLEEGRVLVCGSRSSRRPDCRDPSTYEWRCETADYCDIHVKSSTSRRRRQASTDIMFISIEGVEESNEVKLQVMMGDETISNVVSPVSLTDTVIIHDDPLYEVPVTHTPPGMNTTTTSLCFQVHGESDNYYNLISDDCIQVNVLYEAMKKPRNGNLIKEIGILAQDTAKNCSEITIRANRCALMINGEAFNNLYDENGIRVIKTSRRNYEVTIPNCKATQADDINFEIECVKVQNQKTIHFDVRRGGGLKPGAHGLIGQFWNIPVNVFEYTGNYSGAVNNTYTVTVDPPDSASTSRTFFAELHPATWDGKRKQCLYVGSAQSGAINEVNVPNDHVIEGTHDNYEVSGLFDSDFQYNQFKEDQCA